MRHFNIGDRVRLTFAAPWFEHYEGEIFTVVSGVLIHDGRFGRMHVHRLHREGDDRTYLASPSSLELAGDPQPSWGSIEAVTGWRPGGIKHG